MQAIGDKKKAIWDLKTGEEKQAIGDKKKADALRVEEEHSMSQQHSHSDTVQCRRMIMALLQYSTVLYCPLYCTL
eukprot:203957-Prorocentrum_minimum.AAC.7